MFRLSAHITIYSEKNWVINKPASCEISFDINNITQLCTVVLPKKTKWHNESTIPIKRGDKIKVRLGYNDRLETVFTGYVKSISAKTPIEIICEDYMFLLKNQPAIKKTYSNADLETILKEQLPSGMNFNVFGNINFGKYVVNSDTVAQLLGDLKENGFLFFFKDGILNAGVIFESEINVKKQVFKERINIIESNDLQWSNAEGINLRIKAGGTDSSGNKIPEFEVGDKEGELRSLFRINTTKEALETEAKTKLTEWKISGLNGNFVTFGAKIVFLLGTIKIQIAEHPIDNYRVVKNTITFNTSGYRQNITIQGRND